MTGRRIASSEFWIDCNYCNTEAVFEKLDEGTHKEGEVCTTCNLWVCHACVNWIKSSEKAIVCTHCKPIKMKKRLDKLENTCYPYNKDIKGERC